MLYAGQSRGVQLAGDTTVLHASFRSAEGITVGTDVRLAGINVGSVTGLELDPGDLRGADDLHRRRRRSRLPADSDVKIASESLLGGNYVEITPGASEDVLASGDEIVNTQGSVSLLTSSCASGPANDPGRSSASRSRSPPGRRSRRSRPSVGDPQATVEARVLHLRGLDNLNGTAQDIDMTVGETTRFGQLEITAEDCRVPRDDAAGRRLRLPQDPRHPRGDAALLRLDVRLLAGALGPRPPALRRLGAELQQQLTVGVRRQRQEIRRPVERRLQRAGDRRPG